MHPLMIFFLLTIVMMLHVYSTILGVVLAILEKAGVIGGFTEGGAKVGPGTVSAGYQNFLICIEMFVASLALRYAFPYDIYAQVGSAPVYSLVFVLDSCFMLIMTSLFQGAAGGHAVSLHSISSSLKETINPRDIMRDAIHNFR